MPSPKAFIGENPIFVAFWAAILTFVSIGFWASAAKSVLFLIPLGLATGASVTACLMFAFSRGWIAEGD